MSEFTITRRDVNRTLLTTAFAVVAGLTPLAGPSRPASVHLFDFAIAGGYYYGLDDALGGLVPGTLLHLRREPDNPHDADAIAVHRLDGLKLGFVPRKANTPIARLLDGGVEVRAEIQRMFEIRSPRDVPNDFVFTIVKSGDPIIRLSTEGAG